MPQTFEEQEHSLIQKEVVPLTEDQSRNIIVFWLLLLGLLLVLLSNPLSTLIVKEKSGSLVIPMNQAIQEWGSTLRCIGAMLFAAGLFERLTLKLNLRKI